ncbi:hypothetical protein NL108_008790 [Boleophthalmus pectinirostris]|nr:hypothetical protein NL108_008790 [Boleophthalmus pectinirostris]
MHHRLCSRFRHKPGRRLEKCDDNFWRALFAVVCLTKFRKMRKWLSFLHLHVIVAEQLRPYLSFHNFPTDTQIRAHWVHAIRRDEIPNSTSVCSLHFTADHIYISGIYHSQSASPVLVTTPVVIIQRCPKCFNQGPHI